MNNENIEKKQEIIDETENNAADINGEETAAENRQNPDAQDENNSETVNHESEGHDLEELQKKFEDAENRYLRLYADFENYRRRVQLDREAAEKYRAQSVVTNLLPAIDNLERAIAIEPDNEQTKALLDGVKMVYKGILDALNQEGCEQIEAVGKEFDPNVHQAVMQTQDEEYGTNIVVEEFQKGYMLKDRVIRPSMVKVNQ